LNPVLRRASRFGSAVVLGRRICCREEVLADQQSNVVKRSQSTEQAYYLNLPDIT
jgi:hypothetical protein